MLCSAAKKKKWQKAKITPWAGDSAVGGRAFEHSFCRAAWTLFGLGESNWQVTTARHLHGMQKEWEPVKKQKLQREKIRCKWTSVHGFRVSRNSLLTRDLHLVLLTSPCWWLKSAFTEAGWRNKPEAQDRDNELGGPCHKMEGTEVLEANIPHFKSMLPS